MQALHRSQGETQGKAKEKTDRGLVNMSTDKQSGESATIEALGADKEKREMITGCKEKERKNEKEGGFSRFGPTH